MKHHHLLKAALLASLCVYGGSLLATETKTPISGTDCKHDYSEIAATVNDPTLLPNLDWFPVPSVASVRIEEPVHFFIPMKDVGLSAQDMIEVYSSGGKLYKHFDRIDPETNQVEEHRWEFPYFRGVNRFSKVKGIILETSYLKKVMKAVYPHTTKSPANKREVVPDLTRPAYEIRFNYEPEIVIKACGAAERIAQNTSTKEKLRDVDGHSMLTRATWISEPVQKSFMELVRLGFAYTTSVYTTADHPAEIAAGTSGGKLVSGAFGIEMNGIYTGVTIFMDRTLNEKERFIYDGAGRVAFFAEIDYLDYLGTEWIDSVTVNQISRDLGGEFVTRPQFTQMIENAKVKARRFESPADGLWSIRFNRWEKSRLEREVESAQQ